MRGYQAPAISLFALGAWIGSGYWPTGYEGKYRALVGFVNDQIATYGALEIGGALIGLAFLVVILGIITTPHGEAIYEEEPER